MPAGIDYYFTVNSPWTYLGHERFLDIARRSGATVRFRPFDLMKIFPASGGLPLPKRAPQRRAYRLVEMRRWSEHLGVPIVLEPAGLPASDEPAALVMMAAMDAGLDAGAIAGAVMRAIWVDQRNMGSFEAVHEVAAPFGVDAGIVASADTPEMRTRRDVLTDEALAAEVFGAPSYVLDGEIFWGQDRLDFLERALARI
ncbi:2-hydroxychromene-2-carboxylate isomerase [Arenibaculum sp.]|jgi:carboxymethylenebutenolidase|uniref:2-hydroxychromene-2-carboxylate isomerase n=1 Tax=Arenibaculum sp. TaxID=2865862 RepID=UPI002E0D6399|nr:2-hydroxychromene-2-carboxylate isomerase [Arenibaculum sp.]